MTKKTNGLMALSPAPAFCLEFLITPNFLRKKLKKKIPKNSFLSKERKKRSQPTHKHTNKILVERRQFTKLHKISRGSFLV
jgi:hypothetical protein